MRLPRHPRINELAQRSLSHTPLDMLDALCPRIPILFSVVLLLGSCGLLSTDDNGDAEDVTTYFRATLNQEETWSGQPRASLSQQGPYLWFSVGADSVYDDFHRESLSLRGPFEGPGEYALVPVTYETGEGGTRTAGASFHESDWDARLAGYGATDDASANHLTITSYDSTTGILTGSFHATVVVNEDDRISRASAAAGRHATV